MKSQPFATKPNWAARAHRAAAYVRMSTERQNYSIQHQRKVIDDYAIRHRLDVVATYADSGKSGLRMAGRAGLASLIGDVLSGAADFEVILVYDVSRWGRFQDADESAYYEFICRRSGIAVVYCAELFAEDDSPMGAMLKSLKRLMASEYSRELSNKVFAAQSNFTLMGFKQGGSAGYGLRRLSVDMAGRERVALRPGERKRAQTDRVVLGLGPGAEVEVVRAIYDWYTRLRLGDSRIASMLNVAGIAGESGKPSTKKTVRSVLTNEKYIGNAIYNRTSYKLRKRAVKNPPHMWIRKNAAYPALVSSEAFEMVTAERERRHRRYSDNELLDILREIHAEHGTVSSRLISARGAAPTPQSFKYHFETLANAYRLAGVAGPGNFAYVESRRALREIRTELVDRAAWLAADAGGRVSRAEGNYTLTLHGAGSLTIMAVRCQREAGAAPRWRLGMHRADGADFIIAAQMDESNRRVLCFYLFVAAEFKCRWIPLPPLGGHSFLDRHRYARLEDIFGKIQ